MPLTARQVETAKPKDKIYKIADGGGLYLQVNPNGSKYWRMKYHYAGKEKKLSLAPIQLLHWLKLANVGMKPRKYMPMVKTPVKSRKLKILRKTFLKEELLPQSPPSGTTQKFQAGRPATLIMSTEHSKIMCFPTLETDPSVISNLLNFSQFFSVLKAAEPAS